MPRILRSSRRVPATPKDSPEDLLHRDLVAARLHPEVQYLFHPDRGWRLDFAWPTIMLALEVNGRGRHQRAKGEREDCNKLNCAREMGWRVLVYPAGSVRTHKRRARIVEQVARIICSVCDPDEASIVLVGD